MKYIKTFERFVNESLVNISPELDQEIEDLIDALCKDSECEQIDFGYVEAKMPFEVWPDSQNQDFKNKLGLVFYPELLSYGDPVRKGLVQRVPWIACRLELSSESSAWVNGNEDQGITRKLLARIIEKLKGAGYQPFMDEDAVWNHWKRETRNGSGTDYKYVEYTCYVNPSYPKGHWENHVLESLQSIEQLQQTYPNAIITCKPSDKFKDAYIARVDIKTQSGALEYIGGLRGPVSKEQAIEFFNTVISKNYDKYY
jgi:hypothetical protein